MDSAHYPSQCPRKEHNLRFLKPVSPGDAIRVTLTVMDRKSRNDDYGEVRWHADVTNQDGEGVAEYELLTMNAYSS